MHHGEFPTVREYPATRGPGRPPHSALNVLHRISLAQPIDGGMITSAIRDLVPLPDGSLRDSLLTGILTGLMARGPAENEVVEVLAAALSLDDVEITDLPVRSGLPTIIVAGSGKKGIKSFNVSTIAAIVAAAGGASIVKIGSRATSSLMGSRDLAEALGLAQSTTRTDILDSLGRSRFAFVPIEERIPVLDRLYGGKFHVLNPLSFGLAALAPGLRGGAFVVGLAHPRVDLAAAVLGRFGVQEAVVLASGNETGRYADEFGLGERSLVCRLQSGVTGAVATYDRKALESLGMRGTEHPTGAPISPTEATQWALDALAGTGGPQDIDLVCINAAVMLVAAGITSTLHEGHVRATAIVRSGQAWLWFEELRRASSFRCASSA